MKTMKYLGCLLALVFAGASAFAGVWFDNSVGETLAEHWTVNDEAVPTAQWTWDSKAATTGAGSYKNWTAPLTYTASAQSLTAKDSTITTSVKFTAMDIEDLNEQTIGEDVKGGLTVVEDASTTPATLSYYGIVKVGDDKAWRPLTGETPTLDEFVDVTVELKNNLNNTYTITYKIGNTALEVATGSSFTMATETGATISKVEYLGQFSLESLAGGTWFNPVAIAVPENVIATAKVGGNVVTDWAKFPRGAEISFSFVALTGYSLEDKKGSTITPDGSSYKVAIDWTSYYETAEIPKDVPGAPSKITVDKAVVEERLNGGAKDDGMGYLYTQQDNGQLGWVNVTLGIADDVSAKIAAQPVEQLDTNAVVLDFNLGENKKAYYSIGGTSNDVPAIALSDTKDENNGIVKVDVVVKDEGGEPHVIATKSVGFLEAGKDTTGAKAGTETTFDIVGVPWGSMDANAEKVSLDELLNKSLLTPGDMVYIKNGANYDTYVLKEDNENRFWDLATAAAKGRSFAAASTAPVLDKGDALWIERSIDSRIVFSGAAVEQPASKTASKPDPEKSETEAWSLIANTSLKPLALSTIIPSGDNDRIIVETIGAPIQYEYSDGAWGYWKKEKDKVTKRNKLVWEPGGSIPAGTGFWYVNTGKADVTISFPSNVDQPAAD